MGAARNNSRQSGALNFRYAQPADCAALSALALESKAAWRYPDSELEKWRSALIVTMQSLASPTIVAEDASGLLGFAQVIATTVQWQLEHCWVRPSAMRRGIGRALVARALEAVREGGGDGVAIDADPHAEAFYLALGARRVGVVAAPIAGEPDRVRPQLWLPVPAGSPR